VHKVKQKTVGDFANDIMHANNNKLTQNISGSLMNDFAKGFNKGQYSRNNQYTTESVNPQLNQDAFVVQQEQALLQTMRMFNPNK
jgi:predicted SPOUT superfamily RNA methylase MTH1